MEYSIRPAWHTATSGHYDCARIHYLEEQVRQADIRHGVGLVNFKILVHINNIETVQSLTKEFIRHLVRFLSQYLLLQVIATWDFVLAAGLECLITRSRYFCSRFWTVSVARSLYDGLRTLWGNPRV